MGGLIYVVAVPWLALALVAWAVATRRLSDGLRRASLLAAIVVVCVRVHAYSNRRLNGDSR